MLPLETEYYSIVVREPDTLGRAEYLLVACRDGRKQMQPLRFDPSKRTWVDFIDQVVSVCRMLERRL